MDFNGLREKTFW